MPEFLPFGLVKYNVTGELITALSNLLLGPLPKLKELGSRVRLEAEMHAQVFGRILLPLIDRSARRDLQAEFANLKKVLESS